MEPPLVYATPLLGPVDTMIDRAVLPVEERANHTCQCVRLYNNTITLLKTLSVLVRHLVAITVGLFILHYPD